MWCTTWSQSRLPPFSVVSARAVERTDSGLVPSTNPEVKLTKDNCLFVPLLSVGMNPVLLEVPVVMSMDWGMEGGPPPD